MTQTQQEKAAEAMARFEAAEMDGPEGLHAWLRANHGRAEGILAIFGKSGDARYNSRDALLDAVTAWGWIDGRRWVHPSDPVLTMRLIAPRDPAKPWSDSYKVRAARLEAEGGMEAPGRAAVEAGRALGGWDAHAEVDALAVPDDLNARLGGRRADWDALPPSYRRNVLRWIAAAKRATTRETRVVKAAETTAAGARIAQM